MAGSSRRIVLLAEADVSEQVVSCLRDAEANAQFGVIVAADRHSPKDAARVATLQQLAKIVCQIVHPFEKTLIERRAERIAELTHTPRIRIDLDVANVYAEGHSHAARRER